MGYFTDTEFDNVGEMLDAIEEVVERNVRGMETARASELGLDDRCGLVYIDRDERVIVTMNERSLNYYGGFEYIDKEYVQHIAGYTFYREHDRVETCFDTLAGVETEAAE